MKLHIRITNENGVEFEGEVDLSPVSGTPAKIRGTTGNKKKGTKTALSHDGTLDFSLNERAFIKKHAKGLSGPKKFVLLVAYLAKGQASKEVTIKDVTKNWNRMTSSNLLGGKFNPFYTNVAKENGWVNTPSKGSYTLRSSWMEVFEDA
jgi:hypothetical protein